MTDWATLFDRGAVAAVDPEEVRNELDAIREESEAIRDEREGSHEHSERGRGDERG